MKNKRQIYKFAVGSIATTATIVAPIATVISCGNNSKVGQQQSVQQVKKDMIALKDVSLNEYDIERSLLNTQEYGILPVTRIQHIFETKKAENSPVKMTEKIDQIIGQNVTAMRNIDLADAELQNYSKIFIDSAVNGKDGKTQSLTNPFASFKVKKSEVINSFGPAAKQIKDIIDSNSKDKFSILTMETKKDSENADNEFVSGEYEVRLYKKPANSAELDKAIKLFEDSTKFGADKDALNALGGFTLTYVNQLKNSTPNDSIYSNFLQEENSTNWATHQTDADIQKLFKNGTVPQIYAKEDLNNLSAAGANFKSTAAKNGSSAFQFGSINKNLTTDELLFLDKKVFEVGNLVLNRKDNKIYLELTVTVSKDDLMYESDIPASTDPNYQSISDRANQQYEKSSVQTLYIPLPEHTTFVKSTSLDQDVTKFLKLADKISPSTIYPDYTTLFNAAAQFNGGNALEAFSVFGPHLKGILIDAFDALSYAGRYSNLIIDNDFMTKFTTWAQKNNDGFSLATLNTILEENENGIPTSLTTQLNSSHLYSMFAYISIFYKEINEYMATAEGQTFKDKVTVTSIIDQVNAKNEEAYTSDVKEFQTKYATASADAAGKDLPIVELLTSAKVEFMPDPSDARYKVIKDTKNVKVQAALDSNGGIVLTLSPKLTKQQPVEVKISVTNSLSATEKQTIQDKLKADLGNANITLPTSKAFAQTNSVAVNSGNILWKTGEFIQEKHFFASNDASTKLEKEVKMIWFKDIFGTTDFDAITWPTLTDAEIFFSVKDASVANSTLDLALAIRDTKTNVVYESSQVIRFTK